jgi:predicted transcriptional regulator
MSEPTELMPCPKCAGSGHVLDPRAVGQRWRQIRTAQGISLREMARKAGYSAVYLSDLERGRRNWTAQTMAHYERALRKGSDEGCS